jgi:hypothetical protein
VFQGIDTAEPFGDLVRGQKGHCPGVSVSELPASAEVVGASGEHCADEQDDATRAGEKHLAGSVDRVGLVLALKVCVWCGPEGVISGENCLVQLISSTAPPATWASKN